jgi:hypothetical protein
VKDRPILLRWAPHWETQPHHKPLAEEIADLYTRAEAAEARLLEISTNSTHALRSVFPRVPQADEHPEVE